MKKILFSQPTKSTPEMQEQITTYMRRVNYIETAVLMAGISKKTYYDWLKLGKVQKRGQYKDFLEAVFSPGACSVPSRMHKCFL